MRRFALRLLATVLCGGLSAGAANWPQFRGPGARGVDERRAVPTHWNVGTGANIRWQTPVPGLAHSSPIVWEDRVYVAAAVKAGNVELKVGLYGDITRGSPGQTNSAIVWAHARRGNYMQTPIVIGHLLFACTDAGVVTCFDAATGAVHYSQRLGASRQGFTASPVSDERHVYFTSEQGDVFVVAAANKYSLAATNALHETCLATPAISDGTLFFRTRGKLVAVGAASRGH